MKDSEWAFYLLVILIALVEQLLVLAFISYFMFGGVENWFI